ncbi:MAG TPA: response regulator [Geopsychrobacteraceae bacterium]|nr:response regulator [Geopsychrobacteraceae bacterium]
MAEIDESTEIKILLVDHISTDLDQLRTILESRDYPVLLVESGAAAIDVLATEPFGVVFCNVSLPDIEGLEVLRRVKQIAPAIQVVMLSDQQDFHLVRQVLREKAQDFLLKPFSAEDILAAAEQGLSLYFSEINQDRVYQEAQRRMSDLVLLKQIGETTNSQNEPQELFERIIDSITVSVGVESASLMLQEKDGTLKIAAARGLTEEVISSVHVSSGQGVSGHVLETREPLLIRDVEKDVSFNGLVGGVKYKNKSLLSVPILIRDRLLGVINVNNKLTGELFGIEDQNLLVTIAHQVALAMENFSLVNNLRLQARTLERTNEDLVKFNRARTRMVSNLSHELKTPLTSMIGFVDLALTFYHKLSEDELKDYLAQVREEGGHLEKLITGMLRLFSIESERENWKWREFSLDMAVNGVLRTHTREIERRGLRTNNNLPEDSPNIYGDIEKFSIALSALIDNAIKFNRDNGALSLTSRTETIEGLPFVRLQIANDGESIPYEARETVFDQYSQLGDIDTGKPCGVGVGLALVKAVIDRMQGQVILELKEGEGTAFSLLLPTVETYKAIKRK